MLSPPLLPCQHRIIPEMQISPGSNQYNVMRQLQKQFSGNPATSLLHTDYQPWLKDAVSRADDKSPYLGKVSSAYILGAAAQRNLCFTGSVIHDVPHKTYDDAQKLCMPHNHAGSSCKACFPRPQLPVSVDLTAPFIPPSTMSVSPARSPQRTLQTDFQHAASGCHMNSRLYDVSPPVETTELSLWSMRSHRYQPYPHHHMPARSTFSHPQGSTYMPHLLPPSPEQTHHFSPVNQCNFVGGFPSSASVHHAALLALGDRLNASSTITRRCARCRCPNCLSPTELRNANGKKEHICHFPNCGKVYGKTSHLKAHIRWHLGERPFVCNWLFCGKSFTRSDELQRHLRTHTGEKKFQCQICEKKFMRSDHLSKHVKIHQKKVQPSSPEKESKDLSNEADTTEKKSKETSE